MTGTEGRGRRKPRKENEEEAGEEVSFVCQSG